MKAKASHESFVTRGARSSPGIMTFALKIDSPRFLRTTRRCTCLLTIICIRSMQSNTSVVFITHFFKQQPVS